MAELTQNQLDYINSFDRGIEHACHKMLDKMYYVPDEWKTGNAGTIFNIMMKTVDDMLEQVKRGRLVNAEKV